MTFSSEVAVYISIRIRPPDYTDLISCKEESVWHSFVDWFTECPY